MTYGLKVSSCHPLNKRILWTPYNTEWNFDTDLETHSDDYDEELIFSDTLIQHYL